MKYIFLLITLLILQASWADGCLGQAITEEEKVMSLGANSAIVCQIESCSPEVAEKVWKSFAKKFSGKTKKDKSSNEWVTRDGIMVGVGGASHVNLFVRFDADEQSTSASYWIQTSEGFLTSENDPEGYEKATEGIIDFALEARREMVRIDLESQEKSLTTMQKELQRIETNHARSVDIIKKCEDKILVMKDNIVLNEKDQQSVRETIGAAQSSDEKAAKKLSRKLKSLENDHSRYLREISKCELDIAENKTKIEQYEKDHTYKTEQVVEQQKIVDETRNRLHAIGEEG